MTQVGYEFVGRNFDGEHQARFNDAIGREFYTADCQVTQHRPDITICNARTLAGFIPISMHRSVGIRTVTRRSWKDVRANSSDVYLVWMPVRGSVTITQGGHSTEIESGGVALSSSSEPLCIVTNPDENDEHLSFQILAPAHLVSSALSEPKRLCGVPFAGTHGGARICRELFLSLYDEAEGMDRTSAEALAVSALVTLLKTIAQEGGEQTRRLGVKEIKLQRVLDYMEMHYSDSELTTDKVARACKISTRYLHYLLKSEGRRFYDFLWDSRLNNANEQLQNPSLASRTIAEIAYSAGFKSSAHFSRAFRNQFSCSPREVRRKIVTCGTAADSADLLLA